MANAYSARLTLDLSASLTAWLKSLAYVLLFMLTLLLVDSMQRLKTLAYVLVLSGLGQAVYGSLALAVAGSGNASGTFVNRNHFAAYLVLCLATGIGLLIASMGRSAPHGFLARPTAAYRYADTQRQGPAAHLPGHHGHCPGADALPHGQHVRFLPACSLPAPWP